MSNRRERAIRAAASRRRCPLCERVIRTSNLWRHVKAAHPDATIDVVAEAKEA